MKTGSKQSQREKIIFKTADNFRNYSWQSNQATKIEDLTYSGGVEKFQNLTLDQLDELVQADLIELDEAQNSSPTIGEFYTFMQKYPFVKAHGYLVVDRRPDNRVSLEGLECSEEDVPLNVKLAFVKDFAELCQGADEFRVNNGYYSWWD